MAKITRRRSSYYARIRTWDNILKKQSVQYISLDTELKRVADDRLVKVNLVEPLIKSGEITDVKEVFEWLNRKRTSTINGLLLDVAVTDWLESRRRNNIRGTTLDINERGLGHFVNCLGKKYPIERISVKNIRQFKEEYMVVQGYSPTSINMYLRSVRSFLSWLVDNEYIDKKPKVTQLPIDEPEVKYLNEAEIAELMRLDLNPKTFPKSKGNVYVTEWEHYKRAFKFYLTTGCRRSEPFLGSVNGMWLDIPPSQSKNHKARTIRLTPENLITLKEMRGRSKAYSKVAICADSYSKAFKKACRIIGISDDIHLHSLRHTFACIRRLQTNGNMPLIRDELGHKDIGTTQRYTEIPLKRLEEDFPTYSNQGENGTLGHQIGTLSALESEVAPR